MRPGYDLIADEIDRVQRRLGWRQALVRLDYVRRLELGMAVQLLSLPAGSRVLDVASGKSPWPFYLALERYCQVVSFDLSDSVRWQRSTWEGLRATRGDLAISLQDACLLAFADQTFDVVTAISAIEHVEDDGDARALRQMARVLRPGGALYVTLPYDPRGGSACYENRRVYGRRYEGMPVFWKRNYDDRMLAERILRPAQASGLRLREQLCFGEPGFNYFNVVYTNPRLPVWAKVPVLQITPWASRRFLRLLSADDLRRVAYPQRRGTANGVILLWTKPCLGTP